MRILAVNRKDDRTSHEVRYRLVLTSHEVRYGLVLTSHEVRYGLMNNPGLHTVTATRFFR